MGHTVFCTKVKLSKIQLVLGRSVSSRDSRVKVVRSFPTQFSTNHFGLVLQSYPLLVNRFCHEDYHFWGLSTNSNLTHQYLQLSALNKLTNWEIKVSQAKHAQWALKIGQPIAGAWRHCAVRAACKLTIYVGWKSGRDYPLMIEKWWAMNDSFFNYGPSPLFNPTRIVNSHDRAIVSRSFWKQSEFSLFSKGLFN